MNLMVLLAENSTGMSDELKGAIITAMVTGIISIIGFIVTNISMRKDFKNELMKQRDSIALEKMATMPYEVLDMMDRIMKDQSDRAIMRELDKFKVMMNEIYSYGSEKAITIVSTMQKENYAANGDTSKMDKYRVMAFYVLLATQIKYDVTGIQVNPKFWFRMRITDFEQNQKDIIVANNKLVKELDLDIEFLMK